MVLSTGTGACCVVRIVVCTEALRTGRANVNNTHICYYFACVLLTRERRGSAEW